MPQAIQNFVEQFLLREPMPDNAPDFYFFFGVEYKKVPSPFLLTLFKRLFFWGDQNQSKKEDAGDNIARIMQQHPLVVNGTATLLSKLAPPSIHDIELWFQEKGDKLGINEPASEYTQKFIRRNGLRSDYNDMVDLTKYLTELIDQYNEGKPL